MHGCRLGAETLPLLSCSDREGHLGCRSDFQNQREDLCRYCSGTRQGLAFLQMFSGKFCGPHRTRRDHSGSLYGAQSMGRVGNQGSAAEGGPSGSAPRILRPGLYQTPQENAGSSAAKFAPSHYTKTNPPQRSQKIPITSELIHLKPSAPRRATTSDTPQSHAHQQAPYDKSASGDASLLHSVPYHPPILSPPGPL